ncbi:hypothetical protein AXK11_03795 [Cephaloticoccus primus]|uniref:MPN domain-containing protein n=1 Tax=Cephaloticoccus primus TaxID=1548207 RepID=A0A139SQ67_9BACT|nr:hypothetical protein AXK11_03795 [Cephaloticoccus primus]
MRGTAAEERPQERLEREGAAALSDTELLAMLLRSGTQGMDVLSLSARLIKEAGSLAGLTEWLEDDFRAFKGIGRVKALQLLTVMEVAKRILRQSQGQAPLIDSGERAAAYLAPLTVGLRVEKFWVLSLNARRHLIRCRELSSGTQSGTQVHPREIFRIAIRDGASALVCAHNHPSGDPSASKEDLRFTRQLCEAARAVGIPLLDHIIMGTKTSDPLQRGYYSFRELGLI